MDRILARSGCVCLHGRRTRRRWRVPNRRRSCCPGRRPQTRRPGTTRPTLRPQAGAGAASRAAAGGVRGRRAPSPPSRAQRSRFLVGRRGSWHRGGEGRSAPPSSPLRLCQPLPRLLGSETRRKAHALGGASQRPQRTAGPQQAFAAAAALA